MRDALNRSLEALTRVSRNRERDRRTDFHLPYLRFRHRRHQPQPPVINDLQNGLSSCLS